MSRLLLLVACLAALAPRAARAQEAPADPYAEPPEESVDDAVARSLFEQGLRLYHAGRWLDARQLFLEAYERSPKGPYAQTARQMVNRCDVKLGRGVTYVDPPAGDAPQDPYTDGGDGADPAPLDPYGDAAAAGGDGAPVDPYAADDATGVPPEDLEPTGREPGDRDRARRDRRDSRRNLTLFGGLYGAWTGLGIAGASDGGDTGALLVLGGAVGGAWLGWSLSGRWDLDGAEVRAVESGPVWGATFGLMFASIADDPARCDGCALGGEDQPASDYWLGATVGSAVGFGAGIWAARQHPSEGDVALTNSFGGYGLLGGLVLGAAMDPAQDRAYAMNGIVGASAGLVTGLWLSRRMDVPRARMGWVDLGVGLGAAGPWIVYGLAGGDGGGGLQLAGASSLVLGGLGGWIAWKRTADLGAPAPRATADPVDDELAAVPGVVQRDRRGRWRLGGLALRPVASPAGLAPGWGVDLLGGVW
jgi:hypothetical protein